MTQPALQLSEGAGVSIGPLVRDNAAVLEQGIAILGALEERLYTDASLSGASIGGHFRHVLDHYLCLLRGLAQGVVDYDARERDPLVETDLRHALSVAARIRESLQDLDGSVPLSVALHAGRSAAEHLGQAPSSLERELMFVLLHSVHHYALIAMELRIRGLAPDPTLGMAPATLGHRCRG